MKRARRYFRRLMIALRLKENREELHYLFASADPNASLQVRLQWLENLMIWIRTASDHRHDFDTETGQLHNTRIRFCLFLLNRHPEWKTKVAATLRNTLQETSALALFSRVGLSQHRGFVAEAIDRLFKNTLPRPAEERDLSQLFMRIFYDASDAIWVNHISSTLIEGIYELLNHGAPADSLPNDWREDMKDALLILGTRIGTQGTLPEILMRLPGRKLQDLPFIRLSHYLATVGRQGRYSPPLRERIEACLAECNACRREVEAVFTNLEKSGVSVGLVYVLENITDSVRRAEILLRFQLPSDEVRSTLVVEFLAMLVKDRLSQKTLKDLVKNSMHLISRKIVERAGVSGEHYITRTKSEYLDMLSAGLGGGAVMVGTTLLKFFIGSLKLALFFEGLFFSLNYSFGFVLIQLLGFTLATKQPSATVSALAGKLAQWEEGGEVRDFVNEVCRMARSQVAALVGNLTFLVPLAILVDIFWFRSIGAHVLPVEKAEAVLQSVHPFKSLSLFMAALTGVWLWVSSLAAGWFENWLVFHRVHEGIAGQRRLIQIFGAKGAERIGAWCLNNATLIGSNVSLGFLLGFTSVTATFWGLPLDVRHVTLAAASLTFAICSLVGKVKVSTFIVPIIGVLLIGAINFAVSYACSTFVAARARNVKLGNLQRLLKAVRQRFRHHPIEFFYPAAGRPSVEPDGAPR